MVVLSPPGRTMPSRPSRSSRVRTSRARAPQATRVLTCSANAPCIARTPINGLESAPCARATRVWRLPASGSEQLVLWNGRDLDAAHRLAKVSRHLGQHIRLVEVRRGGDDRLRALQRV